jgi:hypothetical protein
VLFLHHMLDLLFCVYVHGLILVEITSLFPINH